MTQIRITLSFTEEEERKLRRLWISDVSEGDYATLNTWMKNIVMEKVKE